MELFIVLLAIGFVSAQHGHGNGHNYQPDSQTHIDAEIQGLDAHFGRHQCLDLLLVDCQHHTSSGNEMVCGSNGVTYPDHCKYVHAACMFENLRVAHTGPCSSTTAGATNPAATVATTVPVVGSSGAVSQSTMPPTTTQSPEAIAFQNIFCKNKDSINCPTVVTPLCGSDGVIYNSSCHVSKARCDNHSLQTVDGSNCGLSTPVSVAPVVG
ncbi:agrin-like [Saccostrea echinata]|uniref:agrin-like n=1 Tax=Saccostrea echinata TaxID=191078 RepID=UPI002A80ABA1|nr:agrin-like [Saccostrea echinata]